MGIGLGFSSVSATSALPYIGSAVPPTGSPNKKTEQQRRKALLMLVDFHRLEMELK